MNSYPLASTLGFQPDEDPVADWGVVIAYDNTRAAGRAVVTLDALVHELGGTMRLEPRLWRFDVLEDPDSRAAATHDVAQADLLIVSASGKAALPTTVQRWVDECLGQRRGTATLLTALLGPEDDTDALDSPRVQLLRRAVEAAALGFSAPRTPRDCLLKVPVVAPPTPPRPASLAACRILLVEDDVTIRKLNTRVLTGAGYQVDAVSGSLLGWDALQAHPYDLLITDNQMPDMTGLEMVRKLRSAQMALPVIMASGGVGEKDLVQNPWLQPATVLPKPYLGSALLERVAEVLLGRMAEVLSPAARRLGPAALALPEIVDLFARRQREFLSMTGLRSHVTWLEPAEPLTPGTLLILCPTLRMKRDPGELSEACRACLGENWITTGKSVREGCFVGSCGATNFCTCLRLAPPTLAFLVLQARIHGDNSGSGENPGPALRPGGSSWGRAQLIPSYSGGESGVSETAFRQAVALAPLILAELEATIQTSRAQGELEKSQRHGQSLELEIARLR